MNLKPFLEKNYKILVGIILLYMGVVSLLNAKNDSAIFDETAHIPAAYSYVSQQDMRLNPEHPPLIKDLSALPLLFMRLNFDTTQSFWTKDINGQWDAGRIFMFKSGNDADKIIFWSRVPIVILSLLFGLFIFKWAKELAGLVAGLIALTLYAFDPNILGHNHFVTTDLGIAGFIMTAFYYFLKFIKEPTWKNVWRAGFFMGLVQLAKFSSVLMFPVIGFVLVVYPLVKINRKKVDPHWIFKTKKLAEYIAKGALMFAFSMVVVWGVYYINTFNMPREKLAETINYYFNPSDTSNIKNIYTNKALLALNEKEALRPLSEYFLGVAMVFKRVAGGNGAYFMGQVSSKAFPAYFPVVFLIKESLPILFFMLFAFAFALTKAGRTIIISARTSFKKTFHALTHYLRASVTEVTLSAFIVLYAYISITGNLNIGFRHLFPVLPLAYILTAKNISEFLKKRKDKQFKIVFSTITCIFIAYLIIESFIVYPAYMSYFNSLAGGPTKGYRYVTDSNADWGQDLKRLRAWVAQYNSCKKTRCDVTLGAGCPSYCRATPSTLHTTPPIDRIRIDYFGGAEIGYYFDDVYQKWWDSKRPIEAGWYAISTNFLQGSLYDKTKKDGDSYRWILNFKPVHQVGTSILIYYISEEDLKKIQ